MAEGIRIDAAEFLALSRAINKLPGEIKTKAMARAMRRVSTMARTRYVRRAAPRLKLPQKLIREVTTARVNAGGNTADVVIKSGWIPLYKLGAMRTSKGVRVRTRGSYRHAFIATMSSGHTGVMMRTGPSRFPIRELFGPNPAHDITNNQDVYHELLAEVLSEVLGPRVLHELDRILPG
ncbi:phage tail protein [Zhengella mangrovi]|uniref:phage tail protein n=1 Tax=Zhengella mangrovi TaxID=1982044 RepID=UPI0010568746|nr:phage tail protein [Zhengella mangrovi]